MEQRIKSEVDDILENGLKLNEMISTSSRGMTAGEIVTISAWITRLGQLIQKLYGENSQHFRSFSTAYKTQFFFNLHSNHYDHFSQLVGIANAISHDVSNNLLVDFRTLVQAEIFADFLEMADYLFNEGYRDAAAVIAGSVLEDGLRSLSLRNSLSTTNDLGKPLSIEPLNTQLAKANIYSKLVQKQITAFAHIRNSAAHGKYTEYTAADVSSLIAFARSFAIQYLAT